MAKEFAISGVAVIHKVKIGANARKQLQNLVIKVNTKQLIKQLKSLRRQIKAAFQPLSKIISSAGGVGKVTNQFNKMGRSVSNVNEKLRDQGPLIVQVIRKASAFRVSTILINSFFNAINQGIRFTIEFDDALRNVNKILRLTDRDLTSFGQTIIRIAGDFNLAAEEVAKAARVAAQAGLGDQGDVLDFIGKAALVAASSTLEFAQAQESLLAVSKQTEQSISQAATILAKFSAIEDKAAVDAQALSVVFQKAGTSISLAFGTNLDKATGSIAALLERTRQSPQVVGTFIKTALARLSGANQETIKTFERLGIAVEDFNGQLRDPISLLEDLQKALIGLSGSKTGEVLGKVFGIRQAELGKAFLAVLGEGGRGQELGEEAAKGFSRQLSKLAEEEKKVVAILNEIKQSWNAFVTTLRDDVAIPVFEKIKGLVGIVQGLSRVLPNLTGALGGAIGLGGVAFLGNQLFSGRFSKQRDEGVQRRQATIGRLGQAGAPGGFGSSRASLAIVNKTSKGINKLRIGANKLRNSFAPLGVNALGASVAISTFAGMIEENTTGLEKDLAGIAKNFGQLLLFGPGVAAIGAGLGFIASNIGEWGDRIKAGGESALSSIGGEGSIAQNINEIMQRAVTGKPATTATKLTASLGVLDKIIEDTTNAEEKRVLLIERSTRALDAFVANVREGNLALKDIQGIASLLENILNVATLESAGQARGVALAGGAGTEALLKNIEDSINRQIVEVGKDRPELEAALREAILLRDRTLISSLDKNRRELFKVAIARGDLGSRLPGGAQGAINTGAALASIVAVEAGIAGLTKNATQFAGLTKQEIKDKQALLIINAAFVKQLNDIVLAQGELINVSRGTRQGLTDQIRLELDSQRARMRALHAERDLVIEVARKEIEARQKTLKSANEGFRARQAQIDEGGFTLPNELKDLAKSLKDNTDLIISARKELDALEEDPAATLGEKIRKQDAAILKQTLSDGLQRLSQVTRYAALEKEVGRERINNATAMKNAQLDLASAITSLSQAGGRGLNAPDAARLEAEITRAQIETRLSGLREELALLERIRQQAIASRDVSLRQSIAEIETTPGGISDTQRENLGRLRAELDKNNQAELSNTREIAQLKKQLALAEIQATTETVKGSARILEAEKRLQDERISGAKGLLDVARSLKDVTRSIFEAQQGLSDAIRSKLAEAGDEIKSKRGGLDSALTQLKSARDALVSSVKASADAFADFSLGIASASVEAEKVMGTFFGLRDQASALSRAYDEVITSAQAAGASEQKLAELRNQAAQEQLSIFSQLLEETKGKAERFFASSAEDRQTFVQGLAAIQQVVGQFQGNIQSFRGLDQGELNQFGSALIALPQDVRQSMLSALEQLPSGVGIGGLTADEIKEVLLGGALGEAEEVGIERLSATMQTVADLTRQVADTNTAQLAAQQEGRADALAAVAEAREGVTIAKSQLSQARQDAVAIQKNIREVTTTINTQLGQYRDEFKQQVDILTKTIEDPLKRQIELQTLMKDFMATTANILSGTASQVGSLQADTQLQTDQRRLPAALTTPGSAGAEVLQTIGKAISDSNNELRNEIQELRTRIGADWITGLVSNTEATQLLATELTNIATSRLSGVKAEIRIDNNQKIELTGVTETVNAVLAGIEERGFVTESQLQSLRETINKLLQNSIENGTLRGNAALGG